ncbi:MAG: calcium-binding protein, partial [Cyanobacteriota bacterium]|nr:calcium-binding protein [Cyanobacteriota bacterium]
MVVQHFLSQLLKKKVHPITGRSRGPLRTEEEQTAAPEAVDQAGDDPPTEDSQESGETPTNDDGIESGGSDASDEISGEDGRDDIDGGLGADLIDAGNGSDEVDGGKGDDSLDGGQGDDTLIGGLGDDTFAGGEGADLFDLSLGSDVIKDFNPEDGDRIILPDGQEFDLIQDGDDLVILLEDGSSRVLEGLSREAFEQQLQELILSLAAIKPVETEIVLTDGDDPFSPKEATDEPLKIDALAGNDTVEASDGDDTLDGGDGDDTLIGGAGDDRMIGRRGNDLLIGGEGGDTYVLTRGNDTIEGFSLDQDRLLVLKGQKYASEEIDDERGQGLLINLFEDDENPKTDDPKSSTLILGIGKGELQAHNILIKSGDLEVPYSEAGDIKGVIKGSNDSDYERVDDDGVVEESGKGRLIGTKRDDVIAGRGGNDQLSGEEGDDILEGGEGVDTLLGGRGDDWLSGGGDGDVYIISRGNDTIDGFNKERDRVALLIGQEYETENTDQGLLVHLVDPDDETIEHTTLFTGIQKGELTADNLLYINRDGRLVAQAALTVDDDNRLTIEGTADAEEIDAQKKLVDFNLKTNEDITSEQSLTPQGANITSYQGIDTIVGTAGS